jgi:hypothetical protein
MFIVRFIFFALSTKRKIFDRTIFFATFIKSNTKIRMEEKMKMTSFFSFEVNVNIDLTANVNLGKQGGGGSIM